MKDKSFKGKWWLPSNIDNKVCGELFFNIGEGLQLHLDGIIDDKNDIDIINGLTENGKRVTLYKLSIIKEQNHFPGYATTIFRIQYVFLGIEYKRTEDITFKEFAITFSFLNEWVNNNKVFNIKYSNARKNIQLLYKKPKSKLLYKGDEFSIKLSSEYTSSLSENVFIIKQQMFFLIEFLDKEQSLTKVRDIIHILQNFLTFSVSHPIELRTLKGKSDKNQGESWSQIYYYNNTTKPFKKLNIRPSDMLFTYTDIKSRSETIFKKWFAQSEKLEPFFELYFGTLNNNNMYIQSIFLNRVQAIEIYHRLITSLSSQEIIKHDSKIEKMLSLIPEEYEEYKEWVNAKLKFHYEPTLRQRLKTIYDDFALLLNNHINKKKLVNNVVTTRNYYIHGSKELKEKAITNIVDLYKISEILKVIIQLLINRLIEIKKEDSFFIDKTNEIYKLKTKLPK